MAAFACGVGVASAAGGGTGASLPNPPQPKNVSCLEKCAAEHTVVAGATVAFTGKGLGEVSRITYKGEGAGVGVKPDEVTKNRVVAKVPEGAASGKPRVADRYGQSAKSPVALKVVDASQLPSQDTPGTGDITVNTEKAFFDDQQPITVTYLFKGNSPGDVRLELIDRDTGEVVGSWVQQGAQPGSYQTFEWDGQVAEDQAAPTGNYKWRIGAVGGQLEDGGTGSYFSLYDHIFPIRGKHTYGDGVGAQRKGHSHQGQDVFAKCGTPLVAARGGRVQYTGFHGAAGNYLVIDGKGTGRDYAYMHLADKVTFNEGDRIYTGQQIGAVGQSGNASGCHLHFELWSPPGWYEGGHFMNPTKKLRRWDGWS